MKITDRDRMVRDEILDALLVATEPKMMTPDEAGSIILDAIARTRLAAYEEAARVCEENAKIFLSPEYTAGQPLSSFHERFACRQCAEEIRQLGEQ